MMEWPHTFVLFDLEFTSWPGSRERNWTGPNEHREIIQIGAIGVDGKSLSETDSFMTHVKPKMNPILSDFITELTGISQADVDAAPGYSDALTGFLQYVLDRPAFCWGSDTDVFDENAALLGDARRLPRMQFQSIKPLVIPLLEDRGIDESQYSSGTLLTAFGMIEERPAHDAVNDMRNLLEVLRALQFGT